MSKLSQAIKKISGYDELKKLIDQLLRQKPDILTQRGVAYAVDGGIEAAKKGIDKNNPGLPHNPPPKVPGGGEDSENGDTKENGGHGGAGSFCAQELIDATVPAATNLSVSVDQIGCITDIAAKVAGEAAELVINTDGLFRTPSDWTPDSPTDPAPDWVEGWRFLGTATSINGGSAVYSHYEDAMESMRYDPGSQGLMGDFYDWTGGTPESITGVFGPGSNAQPSIQFEVTRLYGVAPADNFTQGINAFRCDRVNGIAGIPGAVASCAVDDSASTRFPMEYNGQLVMDVDRQLRSSPYDPTQAGQIYREGVSSLAFNFGTNNDRIGYWEIGKNDTFLLYELNMTTSPPTPKGDVSIYDCSTRRLLQRLPASLVNTYPDIVEKYRINPNAIRRTGGHVI